MVPEEFYEKYGNVPNIVFPISAIKEKNTIKLYYGADMTCCLLTCRVSEITRIMNGGVNDFLKDILETLL